jgi:hypothetical protein
MQVLKQFFGAVILCLSLRGCILQSRVPLFTDEQGELMLKDYGGRFASYSLDDGIWKKDAETISFTATNKHYIASDGKTDFSVTFAAIEGSWWAMQGQEAGKLANYYLADARKGEIFFYPLACKQLQDSAKFGNFIDFRGDDCFVKEGVDAMTMFKSLATAPPPAGMKLVPVP